MSDESALRDDEALVVLGNLNAKEKDRELGRDELRPVQLLTSGGSHHIETLQDVGRLGINSGAWRSDVEEEIFFSSGDDLQVLDLRTGEAEKVAIPDLGDTHEIDVIRDSLWVTNTAYDEVVRINAEEKRVEERYSLERFRETGSSLTVATEKRLRDIEENSHFHCNQVFESHVGNICTLVHHVSGQQIKRYYPNRVLKNQGDGGVIDLENGGKHALKLKSPHTVSCINGSYWVCDSGNFEIKIYNKQWALQSSMDTKGYGRGATASEDGGQLYVGMSKARKRYLKYLPADITNVCRVQAFDIQDRSSIYSVPIRGVEQISNVYRVSERQAGMLLQM